MNVAGFESNEYFGLMVSDLGQNEMVQVAAGLAPALDALSMGTGTEKAATPGFLIDIVSIGFNSAYADWRWYGRRLPGYGVWHGSARKRVAFFQMLDEELFQLEVSGRS